MATAAATTITSTRLLPAVTAPLLGITRRKRDELFVPILIILVTGVLYAVLYVVFLFTVLDRISIAFGYLRQDDPALPAIELPGPLTDDRLSLGSIAVRLCVLQPLVYLSYLYMLKRPTQSIRRTLHQIFGTFTFLSAVFQFAVVVIGLGCFSCNVVTSGGSICNDARWCEAFGDDDPVRCHAIVGPALSPALLVTNPAFVWLWWLTIASLVFSLGTLIANSVLRDAVRDFNDRTKGQMLVNM